MNADFQLKSLHLYSDHNDNYYFIVTNFIFFNEHLLSSCSLPGTILRAYVISFDLPNNPLT